VGIESITLTRAKIEHWIHIDDKNIPGIAVVKEHSQCRKRCRLTGIVQKLLVGCDGPAHYKGAEGL
jgi:hypothetical protein